MLRVESEVSDIRSIEEFRSLTNDPRRRAFEEAVALGHDGESSWCVPGYCAACQRGTLFEVTPGTGGTQPNYRETLVCDRCLLNNRQRFLAAVLRTEMAESSSAYLYEQITRFYLWAADTLPGRIVGSEFLGDEYASGEMVDGVRHESAMAMSFEDNEFDVLMSQDVFEHVPDIDATLQEASRILRPGAPMWFSIPFYSGHETTRMRAEIRNGRIAHIEPPEYHGNPVDADAGSLVFYEHGWDILERCREAGFADARIVGYWSALQGHIGGGRQLVFVARNPA